MANGKLLNDPRRVQLVMPSAELAALDRWCRKHGMMSRSEALREGAKLLRAKADDRVLAEEHAA